jgi:hypothetical protein
MYLVYFVLFLAVLAGAIYFISCIAKAIKKDGLEVSKKKIMLFETGVFICFFLIYLFGVGAFYPCNQEAKQCGLECHTITEYDLHFNEELTREEIENDCYLIYFYSESARSCPWGTNWFFKAPLEPSECPL